MTPDQSERIITQLATLTEGMASLRRDGERRDEAFELERQDSHLSRKELHEKVNAVSEDVASMKGDIRVAAAVTAQTRETVADLKTAVEAAAPTLADVENAKRLGSVILWIIGGGGLATIAALLAWGEAIKTFVLHWLGLAK